MAKQVIMPPGLRAAAEALNMSPAVTAGGLVFLTGATGGDSKGQMTTDPETQMRNCFDKISAVLAAADLTMDAVVEMTSYHVGLRDHFDLFDRVRLSCFSAPYPAWTAVEVAGLRRTGAIVEIRTIAAL